MSDKSPKKPQLISNEYVCNVLGKSLFLDEPSKEKCDKRSSSHEDIANIFNELNTALKKPKKIQKMSANESVHACGEIRQQALDMMTRQWKRRKQYRMDFTRAFGEVLQHLETDREALAANIPVLEQKKECLLKCLKQTNAAQEDILATFKGIFTSFEKKMEEIEAKQLTEVEKIGEELEEDMNELKQKLISDTKRAEWEETEGLILRGAMKPDDRPLWFDVYKAFPPAAEPKFARPKPENLSIKPILYKEDVIRAKFHTKGQGLSVNMLSSSGETQIRRLVEKYQQLQSEGVPEEEIIERCVEAIGSSRKAAAETPKMTAKHPESVTAKVMAEADLKNIFKE